MSSSNNQNEPNPDQQNRPFDQLDHRYGCGKWISDKDLESLAIEKYRINGRGITIYDVIEKFQCSIGKAQLRLKNACKEKIDKNVKKFSLLFTLDKRTKPQQYYPSCKKAIIIENKRNRLIGTTGVTSNNNTFSSKSPLDDALIYQLVSSFLTELCLLPFYPLLIHNIHFWTQIDKSHYNELHQKLSVNQSKIERVQIGLRAVVYTFNKSGSIQIDIKSSRYPFKIETDDDVNSFFIFLGQVKDRLGLILSDPRERIVPDVNNWILKSCDFNKDVEFEGDLGQILDPNIQIKHAGKAFRLYVKNLEDKFVIRGERTMKIDKPVFTFLNESLLQPYHLFHSKLEEIIEIKMQEFVNKIKELQRTDREETVN